jgi:hypothetical protein
LNQTLRDAVLAVLSFWNFEITWTITFPVHFLNYSCNYTEAGKAIGFALEQPLHVVALPCSALRILKHDPYQSWKFVTVHDCFLVKYSFAPSGQPALA